MQNPTAFSEWLQSKLDQQDGNISTKSRDSLQQRKQPSEANFSSLKLIQYNQRYSDLTFHHYDGESFDDIHPCCLLTAEKIRSKGFPVDFHLQSNHLVERSGNHFANNRVAKTNNSSSCSEEKLLLLSVVVSSFLFSELVHPII
mgnify:CR=1 FL=1